MKRLIAKLKTIWNIVSSSIMHPLTTTVIDMTTGEIIEEGLNTEGDIVPDMHKIRTTNNRFISMGSSMVKAAEENVRNANNGILLVPISELEKEVYHLCVSKNPCFKCLSHY